MSALLAVLLAAAAPDLCAAPLEAVRFGDWLAGRGDYYRAIGEFQRAAFLAADGCGAEPVALRVARAYALGDQPEEAAEVARPLARGAGLPALRAEATLVLAWARHRAGDGDGAISLARAVAEDADPALARRGRLVLSLALLGAGGHDREALEVLAPLAGVGEVAGPAAALAAAAGRLATAPRKSPALAGVLSAVLPGLGQVYVGEPWAGAAALAVNGLFTFAAVDAFRGGHPGLGAVAVAVESLWYGGAIFGAVSGAHRRNRDVRTLALGELERSVRAERDLLPPPPPLTLSAGGTF